VKIPTRMRSGAADAAEAVAAADPAT